MLICYRELWSFSIPKAQEIFSLMLCCTHWSLRQPVHSQGAKCPGEQGLAQSTTMEPDGSGIWECCDYQHDALHKSHAPLETIYIYVLKCGAGVTAPDHLGYRLKMKIAKQDI